MSRSNNQNGSALVYILIAVALLAALTATFMDSSSQQVTSQRSVNTVSEIKSQASLIQSAIQECVLTYPAGDTTFTPTHTEVIPYPLNPDATHMLDPKPSGNKEVQFLRCPGNPGNTNDHAKIFGGKSGKFLPPPPALFQPWKYVNYAGTVYYWTSTDKTDAFILSALKKLDDQYSECEADIIDAKSANVALDEDNQAICPSGSYCFRIHMVTPSAGGWYKGDTDGDEADCSTRD